MHVYIIKFQEQCSDGAILPWVLGTVWVYFPRGGVLGTGYDEDGTGYDEEGAGYDEDGAGCTMKMVRGTTKVVQGTMKMVQGTMKMVRGTMKMVRGTVESVQKYDVEGTEYGGKGAKVLQKYNVSVQATVERVQK